MVLGSIEEELGLAFMDPNSGHVFLIMGLCKFDQ